jgi:hypothetical protein
MNPLKKLSLASLLLFIAVSPALAGVTISSPVNGTEVSSPFQLYADASTCSSQSVNAMGFSLDSSTDTTLVDNNSLNARVSASPGEHTLHVKAWGDHGASCVTDVTVTVGNVAAPESSASVSGTVSVSSPAKGASVASPFALSAAASTCDSESVSAMGYSLDSSSGTTVVDSTTVRATVTASTGKHTLHVKAWGRQGAACDTDVAITVTGQSTGSSGSSTISVSTPAKGASVTSPFALSATASSCDSKSVTTMGYSLDSSSDTTVVDGKAVKAEVTAGSGAHTLHVKAWGAGVSCAADVAITVKGGSSPGSTTGTTKGGPSIASDAVSVSSIQTLGDWKAAHDTGGPGSSSGSMSIVGSPSLSDHARRFVTKYSKAGDERYSATFGDDTSATNLVYDGWVYVAGSTKEVANLEMDLNQVMPNGQTVIYGFQCDGYSGDWDYSANKGTPKKPNVSWVHSGAKCNVRDWSANTWHHVQVSFSRTSTGKVTYKAVWLDGVEHALNVTVLSAYALGWSPSLSTNFQVDGLGSSGSITLYLDKLVVYRW